MIYTPSLIAMLPIWAFAKIEREVTKMSYNTFRSFEELHQSIKKSEAKWINENSRADQNTKYMGQWEALTSMDFFIRNERRSYEEELAKMKNTYAPQFLEEKRRKLDADLDTTIKTVVEKMKSKIEALAEKKQNKIIEMLTSTPSAEQVRLLNVLQMRGNLDPVEMQYILPTFFGNYQAMQVFNAVCQQNGVKLTMPAQLDARAMFENVKAATEYLLGACNELSKPKQKRDIKYSAFFFISPEDPNKCHDPFYMEFVEALDSIPQLNDCKTEKTALTPVEQAQIDWYYRGTEKLTEDQLIMHTEKVLTDHPEIKDLLQFTPYSKHPDIIALARAEEAAES
jgi:hypothetical protein